jgi:hypothetical protein
VPPAFYAAASANLYTLFQGLAPRGILDMSRTAPTEVTSSPRSATLRRNLLELHRAIVALERAAYERRVGNVNAAQFLHVLIEEEAYAWLRPLSALIVQMDEESEAPQAAEAALFAEARALIKPDFVGTPFQQRYAWLVEQSPEVAFAHGGVVQALKAA